MFILYGEKYMLQKRINVGLVISLAGFAISVNTLPPLIEWFSGHLRMPISSFGLVYFFQYGAFTLCSIGIGKLHAKRGLPLLSIAIGALFFSALCVFLIGRATSFILLITLMMLIGGAGGLVESIGTTLLTVEDGSNRMLHASQLFYAIGAVAAPAMVGFLLASGVHVPKISQYIGIFSLLIAIVVFGLTRSSNSKTLKETPTPSHRPATAPLFALYVLFITMGAYVIVEMSLGNWLAVFAIQTFSVTEAQGSLALSLFWTGLCLSRLFYVLKSVKSQQKTLSIHMALMLLSCLILIASTKIGTLTLLYPTVILFGIGCGPIWPLLIEFCSAAFREEHLVMYLVASGSIGALLGPILTSTLFGFFGIRNIPMILSAYTVLMMGSGVLTFRILRNARRTRRSAA